MSETKEEQVQQIQKQNKKKAEAFDSVLHEFSDDFVCGIGWEFANFCFEKKERRYRCVCLQWSKNTFVLGEGTQGTTTWCPGFGRGNVHVIIFKALLGQYRYGHAVLAVCI